jgi:hypothetical protein
MSPVPLRISVNRLARSPLPHESSNSFVNSGEEVAGSRYSNEEISFNKCSSGAHFPKSVESTKAVYPPDTRSSTF